MLFATADSVPHDDGWAPEVKWDRMRAQACTLVCFGVSGHPDFARLRGRPARGGSHAAGAAAVAPATVVERAVLEACE